MEQTIQIKRNLIDATAVPSSLKGGELAVNAKDRALFVGDGSSVVKLYTGDSKYFDSEGAANKAVAAVDEGFKIGNLYLKYDSTNNAIYVEGGNFYATEEVSAFGYGGIVDDDDSGSGNIDTTYLVTTNTIQTISASKTFTSTVKYNPSFYTYNAEDIEYRTTSGTLFGGIGAVHNGNTVSYFYMGTGTTPWNGSTGLVVGEELGFNGYQVWHSGNIQPITKHQDLSNYVKLTGALKNPYTLTWSGYSSGSYDGSAAASITIPTLDGYVNTITTTGSGNAITAASNSGSTITFTKGTTFLTAHQAIYNLTLQAGAFSAVTFDPNGAAATVNIPTTTSHISEGSNLYFTNARAVSALSSTLSGYLPLTGGTLTSSALVPLTIKSTYTSGYSAMRFISSTSGAYFAMNKSGNFIVTDSAWSAEYSILHSGNYNSYTYSQSTIDSKLSGYQPLSTAINTGNIGSQSVSHATTTKRFSFLAYSGDLNTVLAGGGLGRDYSYGLSSGSTFTNGPSGASYGSVLQLSAASAVGTEALSGQLAWDVNHNSTTDATRYLWWRAADVNGFTNSKWHQIAFTDSNVASATKLQTARTIWGQSFDGTGDVSGKLSGVTEIQMSRSDVNLWLKSYNTVYGGAILYFGIRSGEALSLETLDASGAWKSSGITLLQNGNVGIGTTSPLYKFHVAGDSAASGWFRSNNGLTVNSGTVNYTVNSIYPQIDSGGNEIVFGSSQKELHVNYRTSSNKTTAVTSWLWHAGSSSVYASFTLGNITSKGSITASSTIYSGTGIYTAGYVTAQKSASDMRLKTVLDSNYDALSMLNNLSTFTYKWNDTARNVTNSSLTDNYVHYGLSAQELQNISETFIDTPRIDDKYLILNKAELVPVLVQAIKQLSQELKELKTKLK